MPRTPKPLGLSLTEQDVLDQLPALGAWLPPLPSSGATVVEITVKQECRP